MKTFFILGRNPSLSRAEITEFLKVRNRKFKEIYFQNNILILETPNDEKFDIQEFGGIMWIGQITFENTKDKLEKFLENNEIIPNDKFSYSVFGNNDVEIIKENFKKKKKKATIKTSGKQLKLQSNEKIDLPNADYYLLYLEHKNIVYLGNSTQKYNNSDVKKRDMEKPDRRESLAISPRLSKILINLSGARSGILLLDPFCGIGGILQEALVKNIKCYGIDKDKNAIKGAEKNLSWLKENYKIIVPYKLENIDSKKTPDMQFGAIATETPLGKLIKKKLKDSEAQKIIQDFESLIIPILIRLRKVKKSDANIAITFPSIRKFSVDYNKITKKTGLKIYIQPIKESRANQYISREIVVFR